MVNPFRCKPLHKKAISPCSRRRLQGLFTDDERAAIARHRCRGRACRRRDPAPRTDIDLPAYIREHRESLVMKPTT